MDKMVAWVGECWRGPTSAGVCLGATGVVITGSGDKLTVSVCCATAADKHTNKLKAKKNALTPVMDNEGKYRQLGAFHKGAYLLAYLII